MELAIDEIATQDLFDTGSLFDPQHPNVTITVGRTTQTATRRVEESKKKPVFTDRLTFPVQDGELEDPLTEIIIVANNCKKSDNSVKSVIGRGTVQLAGFRPTIGVPFKATVNLTYEDKKGKKEQKGTVTFQGTVSRHSATTTTSTPAPAATVPATAAATPVSAAAAPATTAPTATVVPPAKPQSAPATVPVATTAASPAIAADADMLRLQLRNMVVRDVKNVETMVFDKNDLYVVVQIPEPAYKFKSKTQDGAGATASWSFVETDETTKASFRRGSTLKVRFEVWDENSRTDKLIGACEETLSHLDPNLPHVSLSLNFLDTDGKTSVGKGEAQFFVLPAPAQPTTAPTTTAPTTTTAAAAPSPAAQPAPQPTAEKEKAQPAAPAAAISVGTPSAASAGSTAPATAAAPAPAKPTATESASVPITAAPTAGAAATAVRKFDVSLSRIRVWDVVNVESMVFDANDLYVQVISATPDNCPRIQYTSAVLDGAGSKGEWTIPPTAAAELAAVDRCTDKQLKDIALLVRLWDHNSRSAHKEIGQVSISLTPAQLAQVEQMAQGGLLSLNIPLVFTDITSKKATGKGEVFLSISSVAAPAVVAAASAGSGDSKGTVAAGAAAAVPSEPVRIAAATLFVRKIVCQNLIGVERFGGKNDPFVHLQLGALEYQTEVAEEAGATAEFDYLDCAFRVDQDVLDFDPLQVRVTDANQHTGHVLIGQARVSMQSLTTQLDKGVTEYPLDLLPVDAKGKPVAGKPSGRVVLFLELKSLSTNQQISAEEVLKNIAQPGLLRILRARCFDVPGLDNASSGLIVGIGAKKATLKLSLGDKLNFTSTPLELALAQQQVFDDLQITVDPVDAALVQSTPLRVSISLSQMLGSDAVVGEGEASLLPAVRDLNNEMQLTIALVASSGKKKQGSGGAAGRVVLTLQLVDPAKAATLRQQETTPVLQLPAGFESGILRIDAIHATGLRNTEVLGRQDPYVTLQLGDWKHRTSTLDGADVSWTQLDLRVPVTREQLMTQPMKLTVFEDNVTRDIELGKFELPLAAVLHALDTPYEHSLVVKDEKGKSSGKLRLHLSLHPPPLFIAAESPADAAAELQKLIKTFLTAQPQMDPVFLRIHRIDGRDLRLNHLLRKPTPVTQLSLGAWQWQSPVSLDVTDGRTAVWDLCEAESGDMSLATFAETPLVVRISDQDKGVAVGTLTPAQLLPRLLQLQSLGQTLPIDLPLTKPEDNKKAAGQPVDAGRCTVHLSLHGATQHKAQLRAAVAEERPVAFEHCLLRFVSLKVQGLRETELVGKSDPFAVLRIGEVFFAQTSVLQDAGVDASWPALQLRSDLIAAQQLIPASLEVTLLERNEYSANTFLGRATLALQRMAYTAGKEIEFSATLQDEQGRVAPGRLTLVLEACPVVEKDIPKLPASFVQGELRLVRVSTFGLRSQKLLSSSLDPFLVVHLGNGHEQRSATLKQSGPDAVFENLLMRRAISRAELETLTVSLEIREASLMSGSKGKLIAKGSLNALQHRLAALGEEVQIPMALLGSDGQTAAGRALLFLRLTATDAAAANVKVDDSFKEGKLVVEKVVAVNLKQPRSFLRSLTTQVTGQVSAPSLLIRVTPPVVTASSASASAATKKWESVLAGDTATETSSSGNNGSVGASWLLPDTVFQELDRACVTDGRIEVHVLDTTGGKNTVLAAGSTSFNVTGVSPGQECEVCIDVSDSSSGNSKDSNGSGAGTVALTLRLVPWDAAEQAKDEAIAADFAVGTLKIRRIDAIALRRTERLTKQDPYVQLSLEGVWQEVTPVLPDADTQALWDHLPFAAVVYRSQLQSLPLLCSVKNQNTLGDTIIGEGSIQLLRPTHYMDKETVLEVTLRHEGQPAGKLRVFVTLSSSVDEEDNAGDAADLASLLQQKQYEHGDLQVKRVSVFGISDAQFFGLSRLDPCVALSLHDPTDANNNDTKNSRYETRVQQNAGGSATWDHLDYSVACDRRALLQHELRCEVYDGQQGGKNKKLLGVAVCALKRFARRLGEDVEVSVTIYDTKNSKMKTGSAATAGGKPLGRLTLLASIEPQLRTQAPVLSLPADFTQGFLHIQRIQAQGFRNTELLGKQDPYVKLSIGGDLWSETTDTLPEAGDTAIWPQLSLCADVNRAVLTNETLRVEVWEQNDLLKGDVLLGRAEFSLRKVCAALEQPLDVTDTLLDQSGAHCGKIALKLLLSRTAVTDTRPKPADKEAEEAVENIPEELVTHARGQLKVLRAILQDLPLAQLTKQSTLSALGSALGSLGQQQPIGSDQLRLLFSLSSTASQATHQDTWLQRTPPVSVTDTVPSKDNNSSSKANATGGSWQWRDLGEEVSTALGRDDLLHRRLTVKVLWQEAGKKERMLCEGDVGLRRLGANPFLTELPAKVKLKDERGRPLGLVNLTLRLDALPAPQQNNSNSNEQKQALLATMAALQVMQVTLSDAASQLQRPDTQLVLSLKAATWQTSLGYVASSAGSNGPQWQWQDTQATPPLAVAHLLRDGLTVTLGRKKAKSLLSMSSTAPEAEELAQCVLSLRPALDARNQWQSLRQSLTSTSSSEVLGTINLKLRLTSDAAQMAEIQATGSTVTQSTAASHEVAPPAAKQQRQSALTAAASNNSDNNNNSSTKKKQMTALTTDGGDMRASSVAGDGAAQQDTAAMRAKIAALEAAVKAAEKRASEHLSVAQQQQTQQQHLQEAVDGLTKTLQQQQRHLKQQQLLQQQQQQEAVAVSQVSRVELPPNIEQWRSAHVQAWLAFEAELPQYLEPFAQAAVDGAVLLRHLDLPMLKEHLGVTDPLHLARLAAAIETLKQKQQRYLKRKEEERAKKLELKRLEEERKKKKKQKDGDGSSKKQKKQKKKSMMETAFASSSGNNALERARLETAMKKTHQASQKKQSSSNNKVWQFEYTDGLQTAADQINNANTGEVRLWSEREQSLQRQSRRNGSAAYETAMRRSVLDHLGLAHQSPDNDYDYDNANDYDQQQVDEEGNFMMPQQGDQEGNYQSNRYNNTNNSKSGRRPSHHNNNEEVDEEVVPGPKKAVSSLPAHSTTDDVQAAVGAAMAQLARWLQHVERLKRRSLRQTDADLDQFDLEDLERTDTYRPQYDDNEAEEETDYLQYEGDDVDDEGLPDYDELVGKTNTTNDDTETELQVQVDLEVDALPPPSYEELSPLKEQQQSQKTTKLAEKRGLPPRRSVSVMDPNISDNEEEAEAKEEVIDGASLVFAALVGQQNNDARWLGANSKLTRLKLSGGILNLLRLRLTWTQFDALWTRLDHRRTGDIDVDEFRTFFGDLSGDFNLTQNNFNHTDMRLDLTANHTNTSGNGTANNGNSNGNSSSSSKTGGAEMLALRDTLYALCDTLRQADFTVSQVFAAFDRDNSGVVSLSEFTSLLKSVLGPAKLAQLCAQAYKQASNSSTHAAANKPTDVHHPGFAHRLLYQALRSVDVDGDGKVSLQETLLLVYRVWRKQLSDLSQLAFAQTQNGSDAEDLAATNATTRKQRLLAERDNIKEAIKRNFPRHWRDTLERLRQADGGDELPGPFAHLLKRMQLSDHSVNAHTRSHNSNTNTTRPLSATVDSTANTRESNSGRPAAEIFQTASNRRTHDNTLLRLKIRPPQGAVPTRSIRLSRDSQRTLSLSMPPARDLTDTGYSSDNNNNNNDHTNNSSKKSNPIVTAERTAALLKDNQQRYLGGIH